MITVAAVGAASKVFAERMRPVVVADTEPLLLPVLEAAYPHIRKAVLNEAADKLSVGTEPGWNNPNNVWLSGFNRAVRELREMAGGES